MNKEFARVMHEEYDKSNNTNTPDDMWDGGIWSLRMPGSAKEHSLHECIYVISHSPVAVACTDTGHNSIPFG
eukprot:COSAG02_NODE_86_length_39084_cov_17.815724_17_plen_72_part_00